MHASRNAAKTHCSKGHEFNEANTRITPKGWRACRVCDRKYRRQARLRGFSLSVEGYDALLESQRGGCAICGETCKTGRRLAVDHDHETGVVRGLLCANCNVALGNLGDSVERLAAAIVYLERFGKRR